ncbi:hypothetical protein K461DRAFT_290286 [Myriangium duriaei CBS 260.36]|uniref:Uncharacterized protein n=1 Tax=Myriangium duriaei CBS 260.36 TaxID=1168546 RepID=A0A9P4JDB6_9PEZI|nr:hypothetical protein K461DRAFT_290286 [Myriangium duriaei CBS 260.36]
MAGFKNTLRWVQTTRAVAIVFTCISVIMFSFILDMRYQNRQQLVKNIESAAPGVYKFQARSGFGSMALFGLALSLVWNGLCLFDLCVKHHYRFERRICIFLDMVVTMVLLVTGFLNFAYDSVLYFDLDTAPQSQVILECAAVAFLGASCLFHLGFFCHGCKDSSSTSRSDDFEHVPLHSSSLPFSEHAAFTNPRSLHPVNRTFNNDDGLFDVDLSQKVQIVKVQHHHFIDGTTTSPIIQCEQTADPRGEFGTPTGTRSNLLSTPKAGEVSPFLDQQRGREWI